MWGHWVPLLDIASDETVYGVHCLFWVLMVNVRPLGNNIGYSLRSHEVWRTLSFWSVNGKCGAIGHQYLDISSAETMYGIHSLSGVIIAKVGLVCTTITSSVICHQIGSALLCSSLIANIKVLFTGMTYFGIKDILNTILSFSILILYYLPISYSFSLISHSI